MRRLFPAYPGPAASVLSFLLVALAVLCAATLPASAKPAPKTIANVTLERTSPYETETGAWVTFKGTAPKKVRGKRIALQSRVPGSTTWATVARTKVSSSGGFAVQGRAVGTGVGFWRVISGPVGKKKPTIHVSKAVSARIFTWTYLADLEPVSTGSFSSTGSAAVAGTTYPFSAILFVSRNTKVSSAEYNLGYKCKTFEATVGLRDDTQTGVRAKMLTGVDSAMVDHGQFQPGMAKTIRQDVTSGFRMKIEAQYIAPTDRYGDARAVFGNARILCTA